MIKFSKYDISTGDIKEVIVGVNTTLYTVEESVRVMSDVWEYMLMAYYWDTESQRLINIPVSYEYEKQNTEYCIDADHEELFKEIEKKYFDEEFKNSSQQAEKNANIVAVKGKIVKVVKGKTSVGVQGKVVAMTEKSYGNHYNAPLHYKVAIALDDEMTTFVGKNGKEYPCHKNVVWVWDINCEVINPTPDYNHARHVAITRTNQRMENIKKCSKKFMKVVA